MTMDPEMAEIAKVFFQESREGLDVMESGLLEPRHERRRRKHQHDLPRRAFHQGRRGDVRFFRGGAIHARRGDAARRNAQRRAAGDIPIHPDAAAGVRLPAGNDHGDRGRAAAGSGAHRDPQRGHRANSRRGVHAAARLPARGRSRLRPLRRRRPRVADRFDPVAELLRVRNEPTRMFAELKRWVLTAVADVSRIPLLEEIDPETCYLSWNIEMEGHIARARSRRDIRLGGSELPARIHRQGVSGGAARRRWQGRCRVAGGCRPPHSPTGGTVPASARAMRRPPTSQIPGRCGARARAGRRGRHKAGADSGSIRVATGKVDNIINLVGELLITQSMLCGFADGIDPTSSIACVRGSLNWRAIPGNCRNA